MDMWLKAGLTAAGILLLAPSLRADDAALAARLVGTWEGRWQYEDMSGRLTIRITSASGNSLKGESTWYATAVGDFSDRFTSARVTSGKLKATERTMDFEATVSEDGNTLEGTWTSPAGSGPMKVQRQAPAPSK